MLTFPDIDPIAIHIGPLAIRWYALAYLAGIVGGWYLFKYLHRRRPVPNLTEQGVDDMLTLATLGVILGGRLGYVLFYKPGYYLENPSHILRLWEGGMSFHGGCLGVILVFLWFARKHKIPFFPLIDVVAVVTPIGLFFGRLANFINGELYGRVTDSPLGMVFPNGGPLPRHPSQLYEATLEGLVLFCVLFWLARFTNARSKPGFIGGAFIAGYGVARATVEHFREPDAHLGYLFGFITMGQILCIPMIAYGAYLMLRRNKTPLAA